MVGEELPATLDWPEGEQTLTPRKIKSETLWI